MTSLTVRIPRLSSGLAEDLGDLNGVQRGSLAKLVAGNEQADRFGIRQIASDTADKHVILAGSLQRHGKMILGRIVHNLHARGLREQSANFRGVSLFFQLKHDGFGVRTEHRHTHAGRRDAHFGFVEYLSCLLDDFELFLVVPRVIDDAVVRKKVEGDLVREHLLRSGLARSPSSD